MPPSLQVLQPTAPTRAVALILHGGRANSPVPTSARQLAVLRMRPFAGALRRSGSTDGLAVARLRYALRGWNGPDRAPVPDVLWALDELAVRFPDAPVAMVGHSMGGRAALYAAGHANVTTVVALAPWIERDDPVDQLAGRRLLVVHGARDRMTSARRSAAYTERVAKVAESANYVLIDDESHAMVRRATLWHGLATGFVLATMLDRPPDEHGDERDRVAVVLRQALAGATSLVV